jgi:hypothetical protein
MMSASAVGACLSAHPIWGKDDSILWHRTVGRLLRRALTGTHGGSGTDGTQQVGFAFGSGTNQSDHAILWYGTAYSAVDLQPAGTYYNQSTAVATDGTKQVGGAEVGSDSHAILWSSSASSYVDLNPTNLTGFTSSSANALIGNKQVGNGSGPATATEDYALLWSGSASTAVDLHLLLPSTGTWTASRAFTIDAGGNVYGWAEGTYRCSTTLSSSLSFFICRKLFPPFHLFRLQRPLFSSTRTQSFQTTQCDLTSRRPRTDLSDDARCLPALRKSHSSGSRTCRWTTMRPPPTPIPPGR